jgi:hypothetical protein
MDYVNDQIQYSDIGKINHFSLYVKENLESFERIWGAGGDNFSMQLADDTMGAFVSNDGQLTLVDVTGLPLDHLPSIEEPGILKWPDVSGK